MVSELLPGCRQGFTHTLANLVRSISCEMLIVTGRWNAARNRGSEPHKSSHRQYASTREIWPGDELTESDPPVFSTLTAHRFTKARPPGIYKDEYIQGLFRYYRQARKESGPGAIETPLVPAWKPGDDSPENFVDGPDGPKLRDSDDGAPTRAYMCPRPVGPLLVPAGLLGVQAWLQCCRSGVELRWCHRLVVCGWWLSGWCACRQRVSATNCSVCHVVEPLQCNAAADGRGRRQR